jgi:ribosomal protein L37E
MLIKDIVKGISNTDAYELLLWSMWYFRPGRPSCKECVETKKMMSNVRPNCVQCGLPSARLIKQHFWKKETQKNED